MSNLRSRKKSSSKQQNGRSRRLRVEPLEDRRMLAVFTVDNLNDAGTGSLRDAITQANLDSVADEIIFSVNGTIDLASQLPTITDDLTVTGPGQDLLTIDAGDGTDGVFATGDGHRIFNIDDGLYGANIQVKLSDLTLTGGDTALGTNGANGSNATGSNDGGNGGSAGNGQSGGAILSTENLTILRSTITGNATGNGGFGGAGGRAYGNVINGGSGRGGKGGNGGSGGSGGAIRATDGLLTIEDSSLTGNKTGNGNRGGQGGNTRSFGTSFSPSFFPGDPGKGGRGGGGGHGGAINFESLGTLLVNNSTISGNETGILGVGFLGGRGYLVVNGASGIVKVADNGDNGSAGSGGGLRRRASGSTSTGYITNSTFSGNIAARSGGGIFTQISSGSVFEIKHSTIANNSAGDRGGGIYSTRGGIGGIAVVVLKHSIVAGNEDSAGEPDLSGGASSNPEQFALEYSLIGKNTAPISEQIGSQVGTMADPIDPLLGPLADNGGVTQTHALLVDSPAINSGDVNIALPPAFDQRGVVFERISGGRIDIGSFEVQPLNLVVDTLVDESDGDFSAGDLSLREAIEQTNTHPGAETITFDPAVFSTLQTMLLTLGEMQITDNVTITGPGQDLLTIDAQQNSRIFGITATTGDFTLAGLKLTGGKTTGNNANSDTTFSGGAIRSLTTGSLTIDQSTVSGNSTAGESASGGGIYSRHAVTLTNSTVSGNSTAGSGANGGGIRSYDTVTLTSSTVSGNSTTGESARGGGIAAYDTLTLTSSTVSGNSTAGDSARGGGIYSRYAVTLTNSTVSGNSTAGESASGGGIAAYDTVTLTSSTVSENSTTGDSAKGGGIYASAVILTSSTVSGNSTAGSGANGGGIRSYDTVTLTSSTVSGNSTTGDNADGGGIYSRNVSTVALTNSTVSGNSTEGNYASGGGIFSLNFSTVTLTNSTVSGNSAAGSVANGGGIYARTVTLTNSTVSDNLATLGGGIFSFGTINGITNSIVAGNTASLGSDIRTGSGSLSVDFSLIGDNDGTGLTEAPIGTPDTNGNLIGGSVNGIIDPLLGSLTNNGGSTETYALLAGSPAINAGSSTESFDQRGAPFLRDDGNGVDIGAFELQNVLSTDSADFDNDNDIDGADFLAWQRGFGTSNAFPSDGDANGDLAVDAADLTVWEDQYGGPAPLAAVSAPLADPPPLALAPEVALAPLFIDAAFEVDKREEDERDASILPVPTVLETPRQRVFAQYAPLRQRGHSADFDDIAVGRSRLPEETSSIDATLDSGQLSGRLLRRLRV